MSDTTEQLGPARILVVDDETDIRSLLRDILEENGHSVEEACDGREAVQAVARGRFDLVILDLVMPEQEGIETLQILHREKPELRIVAASGAAGGAYLRAASYLGAAATLRKPFTTDRVIQVVKEVCSLR